MTILIADLTTKRCYTRVRIGVSSPINPPKNLPDPA
jgi:hypothetical protein